MVRHRKNIYTFLASFSLLCIHISEPYSRGAPNFACSDMIPQHGGQSPQSSQPPYTITPSVKDAEGGERIAIRLRASSSPIRGFFIQGRKVGSNTPVGTFFSDQHKQVACGDGAENAITHQSANNLNEVTVLWESPSDMEGPVQFRATVVQNYNTFWTNTLSDSVMIRKRSVGGGSSPTQKTTSDGVENGSPVQEMSIGDELGSIYEGCATSKTCYGFPSNCEGQKSCDYMASYTDAGNGMFEFELMGQGGSGRYVAVGLSFDERMGEDAVVVCGSGSQGVDVFLKWNEGKSNQNVLRPQEGLRPLVSGQMDGQLYCKFLVKEVIEPINRRKFDLKNVEFHVMVAEGSMSSDNQLQYHGDRKIVSTRPVPLGLTSKLGQRDTRLFKMIHGCLMIGAWILAASCGIIFARYFKQTWLDLKCCNLDIWFHFHRLFMIITWSASVIALVLIIYELGEFRLTNHSIIGIVSFGLGFIQPFMAALRPHPHSKSRSLFNWLHWLVGNCAQILGIAAIFLGLELFLSQGRNWIKELDWYILVAFIAFHCLIHLLFSISQCCSDGSRKNNDVFPLKEFAGSRMMMQPETVRMDAPYGCFRKFLLALYLPINWLVTAFLIITVVFKRKEIEDQLVAWDIPRFWESL